MSDRASRVPSKASSPYETDDLGLTLEIHPEPDSDELVAILAMVRARLEAREDSRPVTHGRPAWEITALREGLRSPIWPLQAREWEG